MEGSQSRFRLAVVGGGIGGLTFAIALSKNAPDISVDIYEAAAQFSEIGAGMAMWPRVRETMNALGLGDSMKTREGGVGPMHWRKSDQAEGVLYAASTVPMVSYHRADFLQTLLEHAPPNYRTHFSKRLISYTDADADSSDTVVLHFADGTSATCDVLVGADGIKSTVRGVLYTRLAAQAGANGAPKEDVEQLLRCRHATFTGQYAYRTLIPFDELAKLDPQHPSLEGHCVVYTGDHHYVITYPISNGRTINAAAVKSIPALNGTPHDEPWRRPGSVSEVTHEYAGWEPAVQTLLSLMRKPSVWAMNSAQDLPTFASERVALLGDAAHAMMPHKASGAGQGVEDAMILAALIASPLTTRSTVVQAFQVYDLIRRPFAQNILHLSFEMGQLEYWEKPVSEDEVVTEETRKLWSADERTLKAMQAYRRWILEKFRWAWEGHVVDERTKAIALLEATLKSQV